MSEASDFANRIKALGFRVYIAKLGAAPYGFITDDTDKRVLSFSFNDGGSLGGNYGPPSRESGTGRRMDKAPWDLKTAADVREALYEHPPSFCGKGWDHLSTVAEYLGVYDVSSKFVEV